MVGDERKQEGENGHALPPLSIQSTSNIGRVGQLVIDSRELVLVAPSISSGCMAELGSSSLNHEGVGVGLTLVLPSEHGIAASNVQYSKL